MYVGNIYVEKALVLPLRCSRKLGIIRQRKRLMEGSVCTVQYKHVYIIYIDLLMHIDAIA